MSRQEMIKVAKASIEAYNRKDWDAARDLMARGFVYDEVPTNRKAEGVEKVLTLWRGWAKAFSDSKATFEEPLVDGNVVVFPLTWRGTHSGPLALPSGEVLPTGKSIKLRGLQVIHVQKGKVTKTQHYFDMMTLLTQIGVAPAAKQKTTAGKTTGKQSTKKAAAKKAAAKPAARR